MKKLRFATSTSIPEPFRTRLIQASGDGDIKELNQITNELVSAHPSMFKSEQKQEDQGVNQ